MRLIDAEDLIDRIIAKYIRHERNRELMFAVVEIKQDMADIINDTPTIDAVPVVRCRDCKWFGLAGCAILIVDNTDKPSEDDFCSFGERKGGDE